ncbi:hypothetical protein RB653_003988 [Dictyostelium firmibasis]|uniref:DNA repair protein Rad4 family protein n=1 Tax=Dictyostelium firmibasis TaxID=79012 RepID=A0AAN7U9U3_9MYCE
MEYDDIEWEESNDSSTATATTTTTTTTTTTSPKFDESILNEFDDEGEEEGEEEEEEEEEENKNNSTIDADEEIGENQDEDEEGDAIEFAIDTNEFKSKESKKKKIVKRVNLKEKHNCLYLHRTVLTCYLANFKYTINVLSNEYLNSIVLSFIPKDLIKLYSNHSKIITENQTPQKSRSRSKSKIDTATTKQPSIPFMNCINEIIKWFSSYLKIDEMVDNLNDSNKNNNKNKKETKEIINLDDEDEDGQDVEEKKKEKKFEPKRNSLLYYQLIRQIKERKVTKKIFIELFYMVCLILGYQCRIVRPLLTPPPVPVTPSKSKRIASSSSPQALSRSKSKSSPSVIRLNYNIDDDDDDDNKKKHNNSDSETKVKKSKSPSKTTKITTPSSSLSTAKKKINEVISSKNKKNIEKKEKEKEKKKEKEERSKKESQFSFDSTEEDSSDEEEGEGEEEEEEELIISKPITSRQKSIQANQFKNTVLNSKILKKTETTMSRKRKNNSSLTSKNKKKNGGDNDSDGEDENITDDEIGIDKDSGSDQEKNPSTNSDFKDSKKLKRSSSEPIKRSRFSSLNEKDKKVRGESSPLTPTINNNEKVEIESWIEIFDNEKNRWVSIDLINGEIDKPMNFEKILDPFSYVVAISKYQIKDVTSRYTNNYIGSSLKRLPIVQIRWWLQLVGDAINSPVEIENDNEPTSPYSCGGNEPKKIISVNIDLINKLSNQEEKKLIQEIDGFEKQELITKESKLPFPTSFAQFKSHPIFVLEKDISKYCSPDPSSKPLGLFNDSHKIYHKDQIKILHTSDKWVQNGRMVIDGQQPLKVVKGRSKSNPTSLLYGEWQTKLYESAIIGKDGIVPTNSFGNVYLFNSSMCPINGVHLRGKGLIRVAKKLGISVAPALVGWENGKRASYPIIDGVVVAKKNSKNLLDAWLSESSSKAEAELQKKNDEIKARWKRFMKQLLIKNYIEKTYK